MDPDVTLREMRKIIANASLSEDLEQLAEKFEALDGWLSSGGSLPKDWDN